MGDVSSYKRIGAVFNADAVLECLAGAKTPLNGEQISQQTDLPRPTVMCYLASLMDCGYVAPSGDNYVLGLKLARFWARSKSRLEAERERVNSELKEIGGEG